MSKENIILAVVGVAIVAVASLFIFGIIPGEPNLMAVDTSQQDKNTSQTQAQDATELKIEDTVVGTGTEALKDSTVTVHYTGTLLDGTKFDSSVDRGAPFTTKLGVGGVIKGWDEGIPGMKVGGKRTLTIPSSMGYGATGAGADIPPNAGLIFEVELLEVQ